MTHRYWLGLMDSDGREIASEGYSRQPVELGYLEPPMLTAINANQVTFGPIPKTWGRIGQLVFFEAETGGEPLDDGQPVSDLVMKKGEVIKFEVGEISLTINLGDEDDEDVTLEEE